MNNIGLVYDNRKDHDTAIQYLEKSLKIKQATLTKDNPGLALANDNLAVNFYKKKDKATGLHYIYQAMRLQII